MELPSSSPLEEIELLSWSLTGDQLTAEVEGTYFRPAYSPEDEWPVRVRGAITLTLFDSLPTTGAEVEALLLPDQPFHLSWW